MRTGRASTGLLDRLHVDYYGAKTPLKQLANLATPDPRTISITVYDKRAVNAVVRAIQESDLALTPNTDGTVIRLQHPRPDGRAAQGTGQAGQEHGRGRAGWPSATCAATSSKI